MRISSKEQLNDSDIVDYFSRWLDDENGKTFIVLAGKMIWTICALPFPPPLTLPG
jgi:hypothetical protein